MAKPSSTVKAVFRGIAKLQSTFTIGFGPIRATGVPAVLVAVTGVVLAGGVASMLSRNATRLPETLREARGLAEALRGERHRLNP
ncbi:MAG TPA: hypothetical protein VGN11_03885 [Candidatus Baltobacteraceae bacterium]|jgi:predicted phage tail protein|nr:hypothetical protein [Candidatus Baltobacteraceae bacterium]